MARSVSNGERLVWLLIGAAVGAGIALLYAPKTGKDTRRYLRKVSDEARETLVETGEDLIDKGREVYKKSAEVADQAADLFERGRKFVARG